MDPADVAADITVEALAQGGLDRLNAPLIIQSFQVGRTGYSGDRA